MADTPQGKDRTDDGTPPSADASKDSQRTTKKGGKRRKRRKRKSPPPLDIPAAPRSLRGYASRHPDSEDPEELADGQAPKSDKKKKPKSKRSPGKADSGTKRSWLERDTPPEPKRRQWQRKLKMTREGKYFLAITLGVGFAAVNTGNNLLYLLLGMMLSLIIVSGVMSEFSLRTLTVKRRLPARAQVGRSHLVEIEVYNNKQRIPSYAIEVEDLRAGQPADKRCFFLKISPRSTQIAAYRRTPVRRGLEQHTSFRIATRFPFGLFEKSREVDSPDELIIYPAVDPVRLPRQGHGDTSSEVGPLGRGQGEEIYTLRPMRDGDDPRDIYWKKSTQPGHKVLRERAQEMRHQVELSIDVFAPDPPAGASEDELEELRDATEEAFEGRVREVASFAVAHVKRGDRVTLVTSAGDRVSTDQSRGMDPILRFLALLRQHAEGDRPRRVPAGRRRRRGAAA